MEIQKFPRGSLHLRFNVENEENRDDTLHIERPNPQRVKTIDVLAFTLPGVPYMCSALDVGNKKQRDEFNKLYENLSVFREVHPSLRSGSYRNVQNSAPSQLFSFIRWLGEDSVLIIVNFAKEKKEADIQMPAGISLTWKDQFSGVSVKVKNSRLNVSVFPSGYLTLVPFSEKEIL
jgi:hypothetical protein